MANPDPVVEEIKRRIDLVALIGEHVALKRSGSGFAGLCPFHQEKTPSFHVNPARGFFHCFGCNAAGDAFTFLMRVTGVAFPDALRSLAARAGVQLPEPRAREGLDRLSAANALAADLFSVVLHESARGERGRSYLVERGIDLETARRFRIGYAPADGWLEKLTAKGVRQEDLRTLGLASPSNSGRGLYPLFRERLIFPIQDLGGRVIAFGGRAIVAGAGPKYLNSPETPLYRKGHHLYGLGLARDAVREKGRLLLVEGYLDVIALAQAGVANVAGVLGTAVTPDQLRLARRFSDDIVVCFDGDEAGRRAALRTFPLFVDEVDLWPRAVFLPPGEDPDSLVRREGASGIESLVERRIALFDFFLDEIVGGEGGADRMVRAAVRVSELLARVKDPIVRDQIVRGAAGRLGVAEGALLEAAQRARANAASRSAAAAAPGTRSSGSTGAGDGAVGGVRGRRPRAFSAEAELVELLLCDRQTADRAERERVCAELQDPEMRSLAERILAARATGEHFDAGEFLTELPRDMADRVARRIELGPETAEAQRAGEEWFQHRAERIARGERLALISRLRAAEQRGDQEAVAETLAELRLGHGRRE